MLTEKIEQKVRSKFIRKRQKQIESLKKRLDPKIDYQTKNANIEQDIENTIKNFDLHSSSEIAKNLDTGMKHQIQKYRKDRTNRYSLDSLKLLGSVK